MIVKLPKWVLVHKFPAFYDTESLTAIEQTARLYGKVNELIDSYNEFAENMNTKLQEFINETDNENEVWRTGVRQEFQDFINVIGLKVLEIEKDYSEFTASVNGSITNQNSSLNTALSNFREEFSALTLEVQGVLDNSIAGFDETVNQKMYEVDNRVTAKMVEVDTIVTGKMNGVDEKLVEVDELLNSGVDMSACANALVKTVTANNIDINDISPVNHKIKLRVVNPELVPENVYTKEFQSANGENVEDCIPEAGTITQSDYHQGEMSYKICIYKGEALSVGTYELSVNIADFSNMGINTLLILLGSENGYSTEVIQLSGSGLYSKTITIDDTYTNTIYITVNGNTDPETTEPSSGEVVFSEFSLKAQSPSGLLAFDFDINGTTHNIDETGIELESKDYSTLSVSGSYPCEVTYNQDLIKVIANLYSKLS